MKAYGPSGNDLGVVEIRAVQSGWYEFKTAAGGRRYVMSEAR